MNTTWKKRPRTVSNSTRVLAGPPNNSSSNSRYFFRTNKKIMKAVSDRFLMWIDAVGGYLVSLNDQVVLGQARPGTQVDIPLVADIAGRHARIVRQKEEGDYVLEPLADVAIQNQTIQSPTLLHHGDLITLGSAQLQFTKPHPLSPSARLDLVGNTRTNPFVDGILLMSESLIIGSNMANHVVYHGEEHQIVLFQQGEQLCCQSDYPVELDGVVEQSTGELFYGSQIRSDRISLSLEDTT